MKTHLRKAEGNPVRRGQGRSRRRFRKQGRGVELVEFALVMPLLLLLVAGVWDFGSAILLKERMTNAAREGARVAVSIPLNSGNCSGRVPCAIVSAASTMQQYMNNAGADLSCITPSQPTSFNSSDPTVATYSCTNGISLTINRNLMVASANGEVPSTQVSLTYPVRWVMIAKFLPGVFPQTLTTTATMENLT
jgi:Flp pilus assembly protein TadG